MLNYQYNVCGYISEHDIEANNITMMKIYNAAASFSSIVKQLWNSRSFTIIRQQYITNISMITKDITLLSQTRHYTKDIEMWRQKVMNQNDWKVLKYSFSKLIRRCANPTSQQAKVGCSHQFTIFLVIVSIIIPKQLEQVWIKITIITLKKNQTTIFVC